MNLGRAGGRNKYDQTLLYKIINELIKYYFYNKITQDSVLLFILGKNILHDFFFLEHLFLFTPGGVIVDQRNDSIKWSFMNNVLNLGFLAASYRSMGNLMGAIL